MLLIIFIRGIIIGLVASLLAPLGPVGVMCVQRTLSKNHKSGFVSGLGAAVADTLFATIAFFSIAVVLPFIERNMTIIKLVGGLCIIAVGLNILLSSPIVQIRRNRAGKSNLWQDFLSVFFVTLANPAFILIFLALFATFGIHTDTLERWPSMIMLVGVLAGASFWWLLLTFLVSRFRKKFRPRHLLWLNRISGALIITLGFITIMLMFINTPIDGLV